VPTRTVPTITDPKLIVVEPITEADELGRQQFFGYWLADNVGYFLNETGTRGQVWHTNLAVWTAEQEAKGFTVVGRADYEASTPGSED
jgi:hypothetical protein